MRFAAEEAEYSGRVTTILDPKNNEWEKEEIKFKYLHSKATVNNMVPYRREQNFRTNA